MATFSNMKKYLSDTDLIDKATIDFDGATTNKEILKRTLEMLLNLIPIAEGLYRSKPTQSTCYALSNLISQTNEVMAQYEASIDYDELAEVLYDQLIIPMIEDLIKDTGKYVKDAKKDLAVVAAVSKKKTKVSKTMKNMYRKFGISCEDKLLKLKEDLPKFIISNL